jgi:hypothetical protein
MAGRGLYLERSVHHDGLEAETVIDLAKEAERSGMRLLHSLNRKSLDALSVKKRKGSDTGRYTFGIYFYSEADDERDAGTR